MPHLALHKNQNKANHPPITSLFHLLDAKPLKAPRSSWSWWGVSFVELSVIIAIISIILTSSLVVKDRLLENKKVKKTEEKIVEIKRSLANYYRIYNKLPCPYNLNLQMPELLSEKVINQEEDCLKQGNMQYGGVPIKMLKLPISYAFDEWNNKISYIISSIFTESITAKKDILSNENLKCWIDLSDPQMVTINQDFYIKNITDKSENDCNILLSDNSKTPKYISDFLSNKAGALFDGIDDNLVITNLVEEDNALMQGYSIFIVIGEVSNNQEGIFLSSINTKDNNRDIYRIDDRKLAIATKYLSNKNNSELDQKINVVTFSKLDSRIKNISINLQSQSIIDANAPSDTTSALDSHWYHLVIGDNISERPLHFTLHEFLFFDTVLSSEDMQTIEHYLAYKWDKNYSNDNSLKIYNSKEEVEKNAAFILISHGANGRGAFNSFGIQQDTELAKGLDKENINIFGQNNIFYTDYEDGNLANAWQKDFDDILRYSNLSELRIIAGN